MAKELQTTQKKRMLLLAGIVILLTLSILYFVVPAFMKPSDQDVEEMGPWDFASSPRLPSAIAEKFATNVNATLRVFYYVETIPRTNQLIIDTATPSFRTDANLFEICEATSTTSCNHVGFVKLLNIGDTLFLELLQAPDASRPGLPKTQLVVKTTKRTTPTTLTYYFETFPVPEFPLQKWIMVTVVRSGNRINLYYNNKLVFSKNTTNVPAISGGVNTFADQSIKGKAKYIFSSSNAHTPADVSSDFARMADPTGEPTDSIFQKLNFTFCPSGDCFTGPRIRPANPLVEWKSDVM